MCILLEMRDHNLSGPLSDAIPWESTGEILRSLQGVDTALARHIFSRTSNDTSPYLFMTEKRAEGYDRQSRELEARQTQEPDKNRF